MKAKPLTVLAYILGTVGLNEIRTNPNATSSNCHFAFILIHRIRLSVFFDSNSIGRQDKWYVDKGGNHYVKER